MSNSSFKKDLLILVSESINSASMSLDWTQERHRLWLVLITVFLTRRLYSCTSASKKFRAISSESLTGRNLKMTTQRLLKMWKRMLNVSIWPKLKQEFKSSKTDSLRRWRDLREMNMWCMLLSSNKTNSKSKKRKLHLMMRLLKKSILSIKSSTMKTNSISTPKRLLRSLTIFQQQVTFRFSWRRSLRKLKINFNN